MAEDDSDPYLSTKHAAEFLGISKRSLESMRSRKEGPVYSKIGDEPNSRVVYRRSALREYAEARRIRHGRGGEDE